MHPVKMLEADDRLRYDYLHGVFEEEFEETYLQYHISSILPYELLNHSIYARTYSMTSASPTVKTVACCAMP